eukprot:gene27360-30927_t
MTSPRHMLRMEEDMGGEMLSAKENTNFRPFFADHPQCTNFGSCDTDDNEEEGDTATGDVFRVKEKESNAIDLSLRRVNAVDKENTKLMEAIGEHLPNEAEAIIASCTGSGRSILANDPNSASQTLDVPDYRLIKALETAEHNFVVTDP